MTNHRGVDKNPAYKKTGWGLIKRTIFWLLPLVILFSIFWTIDITLLVQILKMVDPWIMTIGLFFFPCIIFFGAYRWKIVLTHYLSHEIKLWFVVRHYWIGLAIGKFFPASVTWDIYRVMVAGKEFKNYAHQTLGVLVEKIAALAGATLLILCLYPFVKGNIIDSKPLSVLKELGSLPLNLCNLSVLLAWTVIVIILGILAGFLILKWLKKNNIDWNGDLAKPFFKPKLAVLLLFSSINIYLGTAVANYYFFTCLSVTLPFSVHVFLMPIFSILFLLPVTFAGFGIREGAYIFFYGLFGVSMETALIVSFMNLIANLLNSAIGGLFMLTQPPRP